MNTLFAQSGHPIDVPPVAKSLSLPYWIVFSGLRNVTLAHSPRLALGPLVLMSLRCRRPRSRHLRLRLLLNSSTHHQMWGVLRRHTCKTWRMQSTIRAD